MGEWCTQRKKYFSDFELVSEELDKEVIDKKRIKSLLFRIECDYQELEQTNDDLEDEVSDLKKEVRNLEDEVEWFNKRDNSSISPSMLDTYFKQKIFKELNEKYTWWELEEKLKSI